MADALTESAKVDEHYYGVATYTGYLGAYYHNKSHQSRFRKLNALTATKLKTTFQTKDQKSEDFYADAAEDMGMIVDALEKVNIEDENDTLKAKNDELKAENTQLKEENARLWFFFQAQREVFQNFSSVEKVVLNEESDK